MKRWLSLNVHKSSNDDAVELFDPYNASFTPLNVMVFNIENHAVKVAAMIEEFLVPLQPGYWNKNLTSLVLTDKDVITDEKDNRVTIEEIRKNPKLTVFRKDSEKFSTKITGIHRKSLFYYNDSLAIAKIFILNTIKLHLHYKSSWSKSDEMADTINKYLLDEYTYREIEDLITPIIDNILIEIYSRFKNSWMIYEFELNHNNITIYEMLDWRIWRFNKIEYDRREEISKKQNEDRTGQL